MVGGMHSNKKGKAMNVEELRINKQLLNEISRRKKDKAVGSANMHIHQEYGSSDDYAVNSYQ